MRYAVRFVGYDNRRGKSAPARRFRARVLWGACARPAAMFWKFPESVSSLQVRPLWRRRLIIVRPRAGMAQRADGNCVYLLTKKVGLASGLTIGASVLGGGAKIV